jgi:uncharacterized repeat protein (TIGR01451 family)
MSRRTGLVLTAMVIWGAASAAPAMANRSPANCDANDLAVDITRDHAVVRSGDVITYTLSVGNPNGTNPPNVACDYTDVTVTFTPPGGQPQPVTTIASLPSNTPLHQIATQQYTVPTIAGPVDLVAKVTAAGTLHDSQINNHAGSITKDIGTTAFLPAMTLTKTASSAGGVAPQTITYTYTLTNTSPTVPGVVDDVPIANPAVTDNLCTPLTYLAGDANGDQQLNAHETWTYTCTQTFPAAGCHTNVANATGTVTIDNRPTTAGPASATVCVTAPPAGGVKGANAKSPKRCVTLPSRSLRVRARELTTVKVRVRLNGKNIAQSVVRVRGAGVNRRAKTNKQGIVSFRVRPTKTGRLTISSDQCAVAARLSVRPARRVVAPVLPQVTG